MLRGSFRIAAPARSQLGEVRLPALDVVALPFSPVRTMSTATVMLTASSMFPITALTIALPQRRRMRGFSYIVFANLRRSGSGVETVNSL